MKTEELYKKHAANELAEYIVYHKLAGHEKNVENKAALEKLALQEKDHYEFWKEFAGGADIKPGFLRTRGILFLRAILGITFITKLLESHEKAAVEMYKKMLVTIPDRHKEKLLQIINDEEGHEQELVSGLKEKRIAYVGFVALGLADAIVEITGVHAGFLGVTGSTLIAGISGIIVGFSAAISMGSAAYLQAKQDPEKSAALSAVITGVSYIFSVIILALPYFMMEDMLAAFIASAMAGIALLAIFTFYGAVVFDRKFIREFCESTILMLGTALATYVLGAILGNIFDLNSSMF